MTFILLFFTKVPKAYKDFEISIELKRSFEVQIFPLFMGDFFYFHWGWTVALDNGQHHPPVLMSKSDLSTQLGFKMQLYSDKTHQTDCLEYYYNDQQGIFIFHYKPFG